MLVSVRGEDRRGYTACTPNNQSLDAWGKTEDEAIGRLIKRLHFERFGPYEALPLFEKKMQGGCMHLGYTYEVIVRF